MPKKSTSNKTGNPEAGDTAFRVPPLTSLYLYISGTCNLSCAHCWISPTQSQTAGADSFLEPALVEKAVREARPLGLRNVKLTGGEPTLHPDFRKIVSKLNESGISITMETNGTLISRDLAKFIGETPRFSSISVSLDGAKKETHEKLRGVPGCFEKTLKGLHNLVEQGLRPQLIATLHYGNLKEVGDIVALANRIGCGSIKFNHVHAMGRGEKFDSNMILTIEDIIHTYQDIEDKFFDSSSIPIYFDIPFAFYPLRSFLRRRLARCRILNILGILANGNVSICGIGTNIKELVFGNLSHDKLARIWFENEELKKIRLMIPNELKGICGNCVFRNLCIGHCLAMNYFQSGRFDSSYYFCELAEKKGFLPKTRKVVQ